MNSVTEPPAAQPSGRRFAPLWRKVGRLAEFATLLGGLASVFACGARWGWPLELLCHFRVQYAAGLLCLAALLLAARRLRWAAFACLMFAVNAWYIAPFLPVQSPSAPAVPPALKLVSVNVYAGNSTPQRVLEFLRAEDPDVIVVLELTYDWEQRLAALTATHPHQAVQSSAGPFGIAVYSKRPLEDVRFVPLSEHNHAVSATVAVASTTVRIVGAHPIAPLGPYSALRNQQLRRLAESISRIDEPTVVAGDFNITPFSPFFDDLVANAGLRDPRRGRGLLTTWPSRNWLLRIPIDHCLVSEAIEARLAVGPDVGSDHRPLIADLTVTRRDDN